MLQIPNTFGLRHYARQCLRLAAGQHPALAADQPLMVVGEGSNLVPVADFDGSLIQLTDGSLHWWADDDHWHIRAGGGLNWHELVTRLVAAGIGGLENLALIPGTVGAAPVQNIGAYGLEIGERIVSVSGFDRHSGEPFCLNREACQFSYRHSWFKQAQGQKAIITALQLALPRPWQPRLDYAPLAAAMAGQAPTPAAIYAAVCAIRQQKLPDWRQLGNAGSFFKNPLVSAAAAEALCQRYPRLVAFAQADGQVKLAAGWLIDQCGLKGFAVGGAAVHSEQALVLVNRSGQASSRELLQLALAVRERVATTFGVQLEPEVRFLGQHGELSFADALARHGL